MLPSHQGKRGESIIPLNGIIGNLAGMTTVMPMLTGPRAPTPSPGPPHTPLHAMLCFALHGMQVVRGLYTLTPECLLAFRLDPCSCISIANLGPRKEGTGQVQWYYLLPYTQWQKRASEHKVEAPIHDSIRASPMVLDPHMHLHFFIRDAHADPGMWPTSPC
jgi:hypothetical protein